jgi:hypothetical protein
MPSADWWKYQKKMEYWYRTEVKGETGEDIEENPTRPDFTCEDGTNGEVKMLSRPMTKRQVMIEARKGRDVIIAKNGFLLEVKEYIERFRPDIELWRHKTKIYPE